MEPQTIMYGWILRAHCITKTSRFRPVRVDDLTGAVAASTQSKGMIKMFVWIFLDDFGDIVWECEYSNGDTIEVMIEYWNDFIVDEKFNPHIRSVELREVKA